MHSVLCSVFCVLCSLLAVTDSIPCFFLCTISRDKLEEELAVLRGYEYNSLLQSVSVPHYSVAINLVLGTRYWIPGAGYLLLGTGCLGHCSGYT